MRSMNDAETLAEKAWCPACERRVEKVTIHAVSPIGVSVVTLDRCSECETILAPPLNPLRSSGRDLGDLFAVALHRLRDANRET